MIWVLTSILIVLVLILSALVYFFFFVPPRDEHEAERKYLNEMVDMMREAKEAEERVRRDEELAEYGLRHTKIEPERIMTTNQKEGPIQGGRDLIPYNLSEQQKEILRDFYRL